MQCTDVCENELSVVLDIFEFGYFLFFGTGNKTQKCTRHHGVKEAQWATKQFLLSVVVDIIAVPFPLSLLSLTLSLCSLTMSAAPQKAVRRTSNVKQSHSRSYPRGVGLDFRKLAGLTLLSYIDHHGTLAQDGRIQCILHLPRK
jgi:hypothetical protein